MKIELMKGDSLEGSDTPMYNPQGLPSKVYLSERIKMQTNVSECLNVKCKLKFAIRNRMFSFYCLFLEENEDLMLHNYKLWVVFVKTKRLQQNNKTCQISFKETFTQQNHL